MPQTKWTGKLLWQMSVFMAWIMASMAVGGMMPWLLAGKEARAVEQAWKANVASLPPSDYKFCPKQPVYHYSERCGRPRAARIQHVMLQSAVHRGPMQQAKSCSTCTAACALRNAHVSHAWPLHVPTHTPTRAWAPCVRPPRAHAVPLARGYPAPPLAVNGSELVDTWSWKKVTLKGVNWFGFNNVVRV